MSKEENYMDFIVEYFDNHPNKSFWRVSVCLLLLGVLGMSTPKKSYSQVIDPVISFSIGSCTLDVALEKLFAEYDVNVAFSKADLSKVRIPAYSCSYKAIDEVLSDLLKGTDYGFRKIGRQYVIKKMPTFVPVYPENHTNDPAVPSMVENHKVDSVLNRRADTLRIYDTLFVTRILIQRDTVVKEKTVVEHDTTFIRKRNPIEFNWPSFKNNGWFVNLSYEHAWGNLKQSLNDVDYEELYDLYNHSVDLSDAAMNGISVTAGCKNSRLSYGATLSYRSVNYRFSMDRLTQQGDYYVNDTLDTYYVVNQVSGDTTCCYVLDSLYVPLSVHDYSCREVNRLNYLGIGGFCSYDLFTAEYFRLYASVAISVDFLLNAQGATFIAEAPFYVNDLGENVCKLKFNYSVGLGAALKVGERMELIPEVAYRSHAGSLLDMDYPISLQMRSVAFKLGMSYYF